METLTEKSRAAIEFKLRWQSENADHTGCLWADKVSLWRDCLPDELCAHLIGLRKGGSATQMITPDMFPQPFQPSKIVKAKPAQFVGNIMNGRTIIPMPGRFYPQEGMLCGVPGIFPVSIGACRFLGKDNGQLALI